MSLQEVWVKGEPGCVDEPRVKQEPAWDSIEGAGATPALYMQHDIKVEPETEPQSPIAGFAHVKLEPFAEPDENERNVNASRKRVQGTYDRSSTPAQRHTGEKKPKKKRNFTKPRFTSYVCDPCGKRFPYKSYLVRHIQVHMDKKFYCCKICKKQFTSKFNFKEHGRLHTGEKPYTCEICTRRFSLKSYLTRHQLIHKDDQLFTCDVCDKQFTVRSYLVTHRRIHAGEKLHSCDVCNKQFRVKSYLITHRLTHTGAKCYSCEICNKQFGNKSNLNIHKRTHTGEKPHSCDVCKKQFTRKSHLVEHQMIHASEKPYSCSVCKRRFTHKCNLMSHTRIHTGVKPYACDVCKKRFAFRSNLKSHYRYYPGEHGNPDDYLSIEDSSIEDLEDHLPLKHSPGFTSIKDLPPKDLPKEHNLSKHTPLEHHIPMKDSASERLQFFHIKLEVPDETERSIQPSPNERLSFKHNSKALQNLPINHSPEENCVPLDLSSSYGSAVRHYSPPRRGPSTHKVAYSSSHT